MLPRPQSQEGFFFTDFFFPAGKSSLSDFVEGLECMLWKMRSRHYSLWKSGGLKGETTDGERGEKMGKTSTKVRWKQDTVTWSVNEDKIPNSTWVFFFIAMLVWYS